MHVSVANMLLHRDVHDILNESIMARIGLGLADMVRFREGML